VEEDGAIEGDRLELSNVVGFDVGIWEGGVLVIGDTEEDGAIEGSGEELVLGNVVGFDVGILEEEGVCVDIS